MATDGAACPPKQQRRRAAVQCTKQALFAYWRVGLHPDRVPGLRKWKTTEKPELSFRNAWQPPGTELAFTLKKGAP